MKSSFFRIEGGDKTSDVEDEAAYYTASSVQRQAETQITIIPNIFEANNQYCPAFRLQINKPGMLAENQEKIKGISNRQEKLTSKLEEYTASEIGVAESKIPAKVAAAKMMAWASALDTLSPIVQTSAAARQLRRPVPASGLSEEFATRNL